MNSLTKKYRLLWGSDKTIIGDPFEDLLTATTLIGNSNYFETDDVDEIQPKIDELELIYPPSEPDPE